MAQHGKESDSLDSQMIPCDASNSSITLAIPLLATSHKICNWSHYYTTFFVHEYGGFRLLV